MLQAQKGEAMMEALISIVLMAVVGLGITYAMSRSLQTQRFVNTQQNAITELREALVSTGVKNLCDQGEMNVDGQPATITCVPAANLAVSVKTSAGAAIAVGATIPGIVRLDNIATNSTTASQERFGGNGVLRIYQ